MVTEKYGWHTREYLKSLNLQSLGENVYISSKCSIYGASNISIGDNVRIDDFCVITSKRGNLLLEGNNHIGALTYLNGNGGVTFKKYSGVSSRCSIYSETDDYEGGYLTNPTIPNEYKNVKNGAVYIGLHVVVGTNSTILPGAHLSDYCSIGCNSVVSGKTKESLFHMGFPLMGIKKRDKEGISKMENAYIRSLNK
tara:strand:+ start:1291 stop:1878 length:588 start_codon:yes stop_codon:yes gene_type:complete